MHKPGATLMKKVNVMTIDSRHGRLLQRNGAYGGSPGVAGGKLVAEWYSPDLSGDWDKKNSICHTKLATEKGDPSKGRESGTQDHCRLIKIESK